MSFTLLSQYPPLLYVFIFVVSLLIGSFLNVVIYRLPVMMKREWRKDCLEFLELPSEAQETFNLMLPESRCPACKQAIQAYQNIPVISYLLLRGRCANCGVSISCRYPLVEAFTGILSAIIVWRFGYSQALACALVLTWVLIALSFIDIDELLLPDSITLTMVWVGLFLSLFSVFANTHDSIIGAIAGYLSLWTVYHVYRLLTGKQGMGYGDFKLLAMLGAWLGWQYIPLIIFLSSLIAAVIGISLILFKKHHSQNPIPFGPYIALAGWIALLWGNQLNQVYLDLSGLK